MRHLAALLCISMLLAAISACATRPEVVTVQQAFTLCPRPAAPELPALDPEQHVCSPENLERLLLRSDRQCWFIEQQDAALDCYERQAGAGAQ